MSARISKTQASRNKLQGLIREAEILKAQHLAALKAVQTDAEYQSLERTIQSQDIQIRQLKAQSVETQDSVLNLDKIFANRLRNEQAKRTELEVNLRRERIHAQNLAEKIRRRDGKLFDYRVLTVLMAVGSAVHLGVKYIPGLF